MLYKKASIVCQLLTISLQVLNWHHIVVTHPAASHNKPTEQQAAIQDPVSQQAHPLQPGKSRMYPSVLTNKQVPVLNLTETSITSQADLQNTFQSLCLCSHGKKESIEDKSAE